MTWLLVKEVEICMNPLLSCVSLSSSAFNVVHFAPTSKSSAMKACSLFPKSCPSCAMLFASGHRCKWTRATLKTLQSCTCTLRKVSLEVSSCRSDLVSQIADSQRNCCAVQKKKIHEMVTPWQSCSYGSLG